MGDIKESYDDQGKCGEKYALLWCFTVQMTSLQTLLGVIFSVVISVDRASNT